MRSRRVAVVALAVALVGCAGPLPTGVPVTAYVGATLVNGTGTGAVGDAVLVVEGGRIAAVGPRDRVEIPEGAEIVDLAGRWLVPGLVNAHGHVGGTLGLEGGHYTTENLVRQLELYARYGVTTVVSLGGDGPEAIALRDSEGSGPGRARLRVAGTVVTGTTAGEIRAAVQANAELGVDLIKIRVDDNLGTSEKMSPEQYVAAIEAAHDAGLELAAHVFYLDDAKGLLRAGADLLAHSVRDLLVDEELLALFDDTGACLSPTLTREVSAYVYEAEPDFFSDPFFARDADPAVLDALRDPVSKQRYRASPAATAYKAALEVAMANLGALGRAGVPLAFGTDSGPPARFQGYFEHLEMALMERSGLAPAQVLASATSVAATCLGLADVGSLETGKWADFLVLGADPLAGVAGLREIDSVFIGGERVPERTR